jgi:hypothetical protein
MTHVAEPTPQRTSAEQTTPPSRTSGVVIFVVIGIILLIILAKVWNNYHSAKQKVQKKENVVLVPNTEDITVTTNSVRTVELDKLTPDQAGNYNITVSKEGVKVICPIAKMKSCTQDGTVSIDFGKGQTFLLKGESWVGTKPTEEDMAFTYTLKAVDAESVVFTTTKNL